MEFIENNYVWMIVVGVIILMAIIGYFADKAEKKEGEKPKKIKEKKKKEKKNQIENPVPEVETQQNEELPPEWDENNKPKDEELEVMNIEGSASTDNWDVLPEVEPNLETEPTFEEQSDLNTEPTFEEQPDLNPEPTFSDLNEENDVLENTDVPFDLENNEIENDTLSENIESETKIEELNETIDEPITEQNEDLNNLEITLPDIETATQETEEPDDDDVWKF